MSTLPAERSGLDRLHQGFEVVQGLGSLQALGDDLDRLTSTCGASATAGRAWVFATVAASSDARPWAVIVRGADGGLTAAVFLVTIPGRAADTVWLAGSLMGHRSPILAADEDAAHRLGLGLMHALEARTRRAWIDLGPVDPSSGHLDAFLAAAPGISAFPVDPVPVVRRRGSSDVDDYLSPGMSRTLRKARNRLRGDGRTSRMEATRLPDEILGRLPELDACHRDRDHTQGRLSDLDDPRNRRIWFARLRRLAAAGLLELATISIDDDLAAYVLGLVDRGVYRVLEGHLVTRYARYAPGRLLEAAVVDRALKDPTLGTVDWMTSRAPDRLLCSNDLEPVVMLRLGMTAPRPADPRYEISG
ncbi:MAG TPA: GNAT family N-acetyltransferase [Actinomycetes bacterium]|nr:GNAT family N-acetyltransferase [Actinomycetes bacterium]